MTTTTSKQALRFIATMLAFLAMDLATAPLRAISMPLTSIAGFITLFGLEWLFITRRKYLTPRSILIASLMGIALLYVPVSFVWIKEEALTALPDIFYRTAGILTGFWFVVAGKKSRWIVAAVACLLLVSVYPVTIGLARWRGYDYIDGRIRAPKLVKEEQL